jgi:hypothetical protein
LRDDGLRLLTVVGRGGVGKTAMVCRLLKALETGQLPDDGGELPVDAIVYLSPAGIHPVSFPNLFADLTRLLPDAEAHPLQELYRDPQQAPGQLMRTLLEAFPDGRRIVLLDTLEDLIDPATLAVTDAGPSMASRSSRRPGWRPVSCCYGIPAGRSASTLTRACHYLRRSKCCTPWTGTARWGCARPARNCWRPRTSGHGVSRGHWRR